MIMLKTLVATIALVLLIGPLNAHANIIYNWTGDCDGIITPAGGGGSNRCSGQATMHLVTTDAYVPGEVFGRNFPGPQVLQEALYSDDNIKVDITFNWPTSEEFFLLPATLPGQGFIELDADEFRSDADGVWRFAGEGLRPDCDPGLGGLCGYAARGFNGVWTRVPAPSTLLLLGVGLASLASSRRREVS